MTVEVDFSDKPSLIIPKKRSGGKKAGAVSSHVDHIIVVQVNTCISYPSII